MRPFAPLLVILAIGAAILLFVPLGAREAEPRRPGGPEPKDRPQGLRTAFDPGRTRGTSLFSPEIRTTAIGGEPTPYQALLVWCGAAEPGGDGVFVITDLRVLMNRRPATADDLAALVTIDPTTPAPAVGEEIRRRLGTYPGLAAGRAVLRGSERLTDAESVTLDREVTVHLVDPGPPVRAGSLATEALVATMKDGEVLRLEGDAPVRLLWPGLDVQGFGLSVDAAAARAALRRAIVATLEEPGNAGDPARALRIEAAGPATLVPHEAPAAGPARERLREVLRAEGTLTLEGGVTLVQGAYSARGRTLEVELVGEPRGMRRATLSGAVVVEGPEGRFEGSRAVFVPGEGDALEIQVLGPGVRATLRGVTGLLPGLAASGDLVVETEGTAVLRRHAGGGPILADVVIGPAVRLSSGESELAGGSLALEVVSVLANLATEDGREKRVPRLARAVLDGGVRGRSPRLELAGGRLVYEREHDLEGVPVKDRFRLERDPLVSFPVAEVPGASPPAQPWEKLQRAAGRIEVAAQDTLDLAIDPLHREPIVATGRTAVSVKRFAGQGADEELIARAGADEVELRLLPVVAADLAEPARGPAFARARLLEGLAARGTVDFELIGVARGRGHLLAVDARVATAVLEDAGRGPSLATVIVVDDAGVEHALRAPKLRYLEALRQLVAAGGVQADVLLPPIRFPGDASPRPPKVATRVVGDRVSMLFAEDAAAGAASLGRLREVLAETGVDVVQEHAHATCSYARLDLAQRMAVVRGSPARIEAWQEVGGRRYEDHAAGRSLTWLDEDAILDGDVSMRFHTRRRALTPSMLLPDTDVPAPARPPGEEAPPPAEPLVPVDVSCAGDVYLGRDQVLVRKDALVRQGDAKVDGFELSGDRIMLVLLPGPEAADLRRREVARAVVEGAVRFRSPELAGEGEVMIFDRLERYVQLSSESRLSSLTWRGRVELPRHVYVLDLSDPKEPVLRSVRPPGAPGGPR